MKFKDEIIKFSEQLESEHKLITEAIEDIVLISRINLDPKDAIESIRRQFIVINKQDLEKEGE